MGVSERLDQPLLLLLETGEAGGGPGRGGRRALGQGKEPAHPPRVPARGPRRFRPAPPRLAEPFRGDPARPARWRPRLLPHAALASPWLRRDELPRRAGWERTTSLEDGSPVRSRPTASPSVSQARRLPRAPRPPGVRHLPAPPPECPAPSALASSCRALAGTCEERRLRAGQRGCCYPFPFLGREVSMGHPLPPSVPPPPPPPPPGAISMARRKRRSASSETQVHPAGPGRAGPVGKGREWEPERARDGAR